MSHPGVFGGDGIDGVRVGVVADNEDPEDCGRVKLRFPWREADDESPWARVATTMAGEACGTYFLPEVGTEVLVAFAGGDIHRPFVVGSLWNGSQRPPRTNEGRNDIREIESRSGHRITFDDAAEGSFRIETAGGHEIVLDDADGDERLRVADDSGDNHVTLDSASGRVAIEAAETLSLSAPTVDIEGSKEVSVSGKGGLDLRSETKLALLSKGQLRASANGMVTLGTSGPMQLSGSLIKLN